MAIVHLILFVLALLPKTAEAQTSNIGNIVEKINARAVDDQDPDSLSLFRDALQATGMLDGFLGNHSALFTVFAPTNQAFYQSPTLQLYMTGLDETPYPRWHHNLKNALKQHIVALGNETFLIDDIFDLQRESLPSLTDPIVLNQFETRLQDAKIIEKNVTATNGVLHVVDKVLRPLFFDQSFSQLELQTELGPDELKRTALTDVVDFVGARDRLNHVNEAGTTFIGCRIRAFNRLEEYLPQTVNGSPDGVIFGEFLNETYKEETIHNFIEYNLIPKNYYSEDIPNDNKFVELTVPIANCGHMWVTKRDGKLCFNNGCVVDDPEWREYSASNGSVTFVSKYVREKLKLLCSPFFVWPSTLKALDMCWTSVKSVTESPCWSKMPPCSPCTTRVITPSCSGRPNGIAAIYGFPLATARTSLCLLPSTLAGTSLIATTCCA